MLVRSDRQYAFDVDRDAFWSAIESTDAYRRWWPWLRQLDARGLVAGDTWTCVVQPPLPYALRFTVTIDEVVPGVRAVATIAGEIEGDAWLEVTHRAACYRRRGGCDGRLVSSLTPACGVLSTIAAVARPVAQFGHDWVLDVGMRQFRRHALD